MTFRKEQKYRLTISDHKMIKNLLYANGLRKLYIPRKINSCYFDNEALQSFQDSDEGSLPRKKIRFRWYNQNKQIFKEIKYSSIEGRFKISENFKDIQFLQDYQTQLFDTDYGLMKPVLLVEYIREYYLLKGVRVTFDSNITYTDLRISNGRRFYDCETVLELKAPYYISNDSLDDLIKMPTSRFSKYCRGILMQERIL